MNPGKFGKYLENEFMLNPVEIWQELNDELFLGSCRTVRLH
jgi:hypothetical protein